MQTKTNIRKRAHTHTAPQMMAMKKEMFDPHVNLHCSTAAHRLVRYKFHVLHTFSVAIEAVFLIRLFIYCKYGKSNCHITDTEINDTTTNNQRERE